MKKLYTLFAITLLTPALTFALSYGSYPNDATVPSDCAASDNVLMVYVYAGNIDPELTYYTHITNVMCDTPTTFAELSLENQVYNVIEVTQSTYLSSPCQETADYQTCLDSSVSSGYFMVGTVPNEYFMSSVGILVVSSIGGMSYYVLLVLGAFILIAGGIVLFRMGYKWFRKSVR